VIQVVNSGEEMGKNYEKEFFEHFEGSSSKEQSLDSLSDLYAEDGQQTEFEVLGELILRFQDGSIDPKQFAQLRDWLLNDCKAMEYYVEFGYLYAGLNILLNKKPDLAFLNPLVKV
jgi:hypothetical protein